MPARKALARCAASAATEQQQLTNDIRAEWTAPSLSQCLVCGEVRSLCLPLSSHCAPNTPPQCADIHDREEEQAEVREAAPDKLPIHVLEHMEPLHALWARLHQS